MNNPEIKHNESSPSLKKSELEQRQYLKEYLQINPLETESIELIRAENLPEAYRAQYAFLNDPSLADVSIAVIPDVLWRKSRQPSESSAQNQLISFKASYFKTQEKPDEIGWMAHELTHCQAFMKLKSKETYEEAMRKPAFEDIQSEYPYPNNLIEKFTFTKQFSFLKSTGCSREKVTEMLKAYYSEEDTPFFERILNSVYI